MYNVVSHGAFLFNGSFQCMDYIWSSVSSSRYSLMLQKELWWNSLWGNVFVCLFLFVCFPHSKTLLSHQSHWRKCHLARPAESELNLGEVCAVQNLLMLACGRKPVLLVCEWKEFQIFALHQRFFTFLCYLIGWELRKAHLPAWLEQIRISVLFT